MDLAGKTDEVDAVDGAAALLTPAAAAQAAAPGINLSHVADTGDPFNTSAWTVTSPGGKHSLAVGINADVTVTVEGHAGYYAAGMHQKGDVTINGNAGVGLAENIMSGRVHVKGDASQSAAAGGWRTSRRCAAAAGWDGPTAGGRTG